MAKGKKSKKGGDRVMIGRIARVRKDGEEIKFYDSYRKEKREGRYAPVGVLFAAEPDEDGKTMISVKFEAKFEPDEDEEWYNMYLSDGVKIEFDAAEVKAGTKGGKSKGKGKRRDEEEDEDESDEEESEDEGEEEDPFA